MSRTTSTIVAALLIATASFAATDAGVAKPLGHSAHHSKHRPLRSAPVYLEREQRHPSKWGDPGFYDGWVPPPLHAGGVG
jgi:hypothetical protein